METVLTRKLGKTISFLQTLFRPLQSYRLYACFLMLITSLIGGNFNEIQAQADAIITQKSVVGNETSFETGVYFTYAVTLECSGVEPCQNFVLTEVLPLGLEFDDLDAVILPSSGGFANGVLDASTYNRGIDPNFMQPGQAIINFGDVPPGSSGVVLFTVRFQKHGTVPNGYSVINEASVSSDNDFQPSNNTAAAPSVTAIAEMEHFLRKRTKDDINETLLNSVNVYDIDVLNSFSSLNYENELREGLLALYNPFVIDFLETGLTCADVDAATTTGYAANNAACLLPGATHTFASGRMFTNPSATDVAVVYDLEAILATPDPYYPNEVCPTNASDPSCNMVPGTVNAFNLDTGNGNEPFVQLSLGVSYSEPTFTAGQVVVNDAELWGSFPTALGGTTVSPIALLDQDNATHTLLRPSANGSLGKLGIDAVGGTRNRSNTAVGNIATFLHSVRNTSNVPVQATLRDEIPTELSVNQIAFTNMNGGITYSVMLTYTDGSTETVNGVSTGSNVIIESGTDFTVPAGEHVDVVEIVFDELADNNSRVYISGEVLANRWGDDRHTASVDPVDPGNQLDGSAVMVDERLTNCSSLELEHLPSGTSFSTSSCAQLLIRESYIEMTIDKSSVGGAALQSGDIFEFQIFPRYIPVNPVLPTSFIVTDTLPINTSYVDGSFGIRGGGCGERDISLAVSQDPVSGRDILTWTTRPLPGFESTYLNGGCAFIIDARIEEGHLAGNFDNTAYISDFEHPTANFIRTAGGEVVAESGVFSNISAEGGYSVVALPAGDAVKLVDADLTPGVSSSGGVEVGSLGSTATFTMVFTNSGNDNLTNLRLVDYLPHLGDVTLTTCVPRNTEWEPEFAGNVVTTFTRGGVSSILTPDIQYSTSNDPCVEYYTVGPEPCLPCSGVFDPAVPSPLADVQALGVDFGNLIIEPGDSITIAFEVQIPSASAPDGIAWNSFAWRADGIISGLEVGAEPPLVGITTDQFDLALIKTLNSSTPGTEGPAVFVPGDAVTFDIQVVNQGEFLTHDLDVLDYFDPAQLTFTGFSSPTISNGGAALGITVTDSDGSDGTVGFEVSELPAEDTVIVTASFTISPDFAGTIVNNAEIVAGSLTDGGMTEFDVDSDLNMTGGNGTDEVDNEIADDFDGGVDNPNDQDDFDFDSITVVRVFDLALTKVTNTTGVVRPGEIVSFDISIYNQGNVTAYDIDVNDYFNPAEITFQNLIPAATTEMGATPSVIGAGPNFELEELAAGDTMVVTIRFVVNTGFSGASIINNAEIVDASHTDGGTTTLDEDSPLTDINDGSTNELSTDNEIGDDSTGGTDNPNDEDDYDAAQVEVCTAGCGSFPWNGNDD